MIAVRLENGGEHPRLGRLEARRAGFRADVDWGTLYGPAWAGMTGRDPASVVLAAGSPVSVFPHGKVG